MVRLLKVSSLLLAFIAALSFSSCAALLNSRGVEGVTDDKESTDTGDSSGDVDEGGGEKCAVCEKSLLSVDGLNLKEAVEWREILAGLDAADSEEAISLDEKIADLIVEAIDYPALADDATLVGANFFGVKEALHSYLAACGYGFDKYDNILPMNSKGMLGEINYASLSAMTKEERTVVQNTLANAQKALAAREDFLKIANSLDVIAKDLQTARITQVIEAVDKGVPSADPAVVWKEAFACTFCRNIVNFSLCKDNNSALYNACESFNKDPKSYYSRVIESLNNRLKEISPLLEGMSKTVQAELEQDLNDAKAAYEACKKTSCSELAALDQAARDAQLALDAFIKDPKAWMTLNWQPYIDLKAEEVSIKQRVQIAGSPCVKPDK